MPIPVSKPACSPSNVSSGWGLIFGSSKDLNCTYESVTNHEEHYHGTINKFGVDVGYHNGGVIIWAVVAPSADIAPHALAGDYGGVTAGGAVGIGAGANALGGRQRQKHRAAAGQRRGPHRTERGRGRRLDHTAARRITVLVVPVA